MEDQTRYHTKTRISRKELFEKVWETPIDHLAKEFGVSGSYLARVCAALNVPRPPVGYWQKKAVGRAKPRPDLPPALPGDQLSWTKDQAISPPLKRNIPPKVDSTSEARAAKARLHPMLLGVEGAFRKSRNTEDGEFLRPYKHLLPDIVSSAASLTRALEVANTIYNALERTGHRVLFAPPGSNMYRSEIKEQEVPLKNSKYGRYGTTRIWSPHRPTVTYIGSVPVGLALTEMTERVPLRWIKGKYVREISKSAGSAKPWDAASSLTTEQDLPSGRFRLVAYSPLAGVDWTCSWQETAANSIDKMSAVIVRKLASAEQELRTLAEEAANLAAQRQREREETQERWRREEDRRLVFQATEDSRKQLFGVISRWSEAVAIARFFLEAEVRLEGVDSERRNTLEERLALGRALLGTLDPLDFLEEWLAPDERYKSKYDQN